jgi:cardiolipin synthase A/B
MRVMRTKPVTTVKPEVGRPLVTRGFVDESFERATGAPIIHGNNVRLLVDAAENYPSWLEAIGYARDRIYFESYIIHDDDQGRLFAEALIKKAGEGVDVKVIYDWMGGFGKTSWMFWRRLWKAGIDVRCYNPPNLLDPLGVLSRDHRKSLVVDGRIAFVSGLCVGRDWVGDESREIQPWRDTGVEIRGPAVADVEAAFATVWAATGGKIEKSRLVRREGLGEEGEIKLRVVQTIPTTAYIYRMDLVLATFARERMWLTDAYFVGTPSYLQALKDASEDGVDVRLLLPQSSDIGVIRDTTRSTYRPLLEAGIRIFEWNGPMVHAKTAVFDGKISRVGSTNMNIASWFGNYELDVLVEDESFSERMEQMYLRDLENATEIVLADTDRVRLKRPKQKRSRRRGSGSVRKVTAGAINAATSIGSAITRKTHLGPAEARLLLMVGAVLLGYALLLIKFPRGASIPLVAALLILAVSTLVKALRNYQDN